jgi:hypothetical protein
MRASADGGAGPTVNGKIGWHGRRSLCRKEEFVSEGRVFGWLTEQEVLGRIEGFRAVDGGSGLDERVFW